MGEVTYGVLETRDHLPGVVRGSTSVLNELVDKVVKTPELHRKAVLIAEYRQSTAAGAAANVLRQRNGKTMEARGLEFRSARVPNKDATGLWVYFDPGKVVAGAWEKHQEAEAARKARIQENAKAREKAKENGKEKKAAPAKA